MKKKTVIYSEEPKDPSWRFDPKAKAMSAEQLRALGMPPQNPQGTAYERTETAGQVMLTPKRGGARIGAGRKANGNVRLQLLVPSETREKIERIAAREKISLSEAVCRAVSRA